MEVLALATGVTLVGSMNDLVTKITANVYTQRYAFFVDQGANILYALIAAVPVLCSIAFERRGSLLERLPEGLLRCPQHRFAFMGFLDGLGTFLSSIGAPGTPGHLQVVLNQTLILFTMITAFACLGTRHDAREVACACLIFGGALVAASGSTMGSGAQAWSVVMFMLSNVPMALSNVYKESGFADKSMRLDVWSMTMTTTFYQILTTFAVLPLQTLPYLSGDPRRGLSLAESWESFVGGQSCFFGDGRPGDGVDCRVAGLWLMLYVVANLGFNFLSLCLNKLGSATGVGATLCSLAYALKLPISNLLFAQRWLMGSQVEQLSPRSLVGLVVVVAGFLGYLYYSGPGKGDAKEKALAAERGLLTLSPPPPPPPDEAPPSPGEGATRYVRLPRDDDDEGSPLRSLMRRVGSTSAIPDDSEPWAFHDRLIGCDSSNSTRLVSSRQLKKGMAQLMCGAAGPPQRDEQPG